MKITVFADAVVPTHAQIFDAINQMGYEPPLTASADFVSSKLPEQWVLLYNVACNLCGKASGKGKANLNQLAVMYVIYKDATVNVGNYIFSSFLTVNEKKKAGEIQFHRFWSVIVAETIKKVKEYVEEPNAAILLFIDDFSQIS